MSDDINYTDSDLVPDNKSEEPTPKQEEVAQETAAEPTKAANVEVSAPCKTAIEGKIFPPHEALAILMSSLADFNSVIENSANMNYAADEAGRNWMHLVAQATKHYARSGSFVASVDREDSLWRQNVENNGERISISRPKTDSNRDGETVKLSGDKAIFKITNTLGLGTVVQVPLWHSGIWVTIKAPSDSALLELERRIAQEKIEMGRHTNGMVFSNTSVYISHHLINFILSHVYDSSLKTNSKNNFKRSILVTDLPLLVWGMVCAIYPNGYNFSQPCTANPDKCQHVTHELINITKLCWTDNSALSAKQKTHMSKRNDKFQHENLLAYRDEHTHGQARTVQVHDNLSVKLKVPNLEEYEKSGFKWVDRLAEMSMNAFDVELKTEERNDYINAQARTTALRQYGHWIAEISLSDGSVIEDVETIEDALDRLSAEREVSKKLFTEIGKFIDDATISLIAIPQYECPSCGGLQKEPHSRYTRLIPLGVNQIFFTLLDQRLEKTLGDLA